MNQNSKIIIYISNLVIERILVYVNSLVIAIISAAAAAIFMNIFMFLRETYIKCDQIETDREKLAKALHSEISTLIDLYRKNPVSPDTPRQGSDIRIVHLNCNYISVFENNTDKLGLLDKDDISSIITLYIHIKGLMDTLIVFATRWDTYALYSRSAQNEPNYERENAARLNDVATVHPVALNYQDKVFNEYQNVLNLLDKYIK